MSDDSSEDEDYANVERPFHLVSLFARVVVVVVDVLAVVLAVVVAVVAAKLCLVTRNLYKYCIQRTRFSTGR